MALNLLMRYWKHLAVILLVLAVYRAGYTHGRDAVQSDWDKATAQATEQWRAKSEEYQETIATQRARIIANQKGIQHAIAKSYTGCTANADIVGVWAKTYGSAD